MAQLDQTVDQELRMGFKGHIGQEEKTNMEDLAYMKPLVIATDIKGSVDDLSTMIATVMSTDPLVRRIVTMAITKVMLFDLDQIHLEYHKVRSDMDGGEKHD